MKLERSIGWIVVAAALALLFTGLAQASGNLVPTTWAVDGKDDLSLRGATRQRDVSSSSGGAYALAADHSPSVDGQTTNWVFLPLAYKEYPCCETAPTLLSPANDSQLDTLTPTYRWDAGQNPKATAVQIEVAPDEDFRSLAQSLGYGSGQGIGEYPRLWPNLSPDTRYYWRAYLYCGTVRGPYSQTWTFTSGSGGTVLPPPALLSPADGENLVSTTVTLMWSAVAGATDYLVFYQKTGAGSYALTASSNSRTISGLAPGSTYQWSVRARNAYAVGEPSPNWSFSTPAAAGAEPGWAASLGMVVRLGDEAELWVLPAETE